MLSKAEIEQKVSEYRDSLYAEQQKERKEAMIAYMEEAQRIVASWPAWKRNVLRKPEEWQNADR